MKSKLYILVLLSIALALAGCSRPKYGVVEYINYFKNPANGLIAGAAIPGFRFEAGILSREFVALTNLYDEGLDFSQHQLDSSVDLVENFTYVVLKIRKNGQKESWKGDASYFSEQFKQQVKLLNGAAEIPCVAITLESPTDDELRTIILGFPKPLSELTEPLTLIISGKEVPGNEINIDFGKFNAAKLPILVSA